MRPSRSLADLEVVGFASFLEKPTLPRLLAPVFRVKKQPDCYLLPPFNIVADEVFNFGESDFPRLQSYVAQRKLTLLEEIKPAATRHDLWTNEHGQVHYTPERTRKEAFAQIYQEQLGRAEQAFKGGDDEAARAHAITARAIAPQSLSPLIVIAAAAKVAAQRRRLLSARKLARSYTDLQQFDGLVRRFMRQQGREENHGCLVMRRVAEQHAELLSV